MNVAAVIHLGRKSYRARPIKRARRSKADMQVIRQALLRELEADHPMTVRQCYYRLVATNVIEKTEAQYKGTVCRLLVDMREEGLIPYSWIADNTRWMLKQDSYTGLEAALDATAECYRRAIWEDQNAYVEVWCESDAIAGVLYQETNEWDVPLMVVRGFSSVSFLYSAGETLREKKKPSFIYYFGDWDPSGVAIARNVEQKLRKFAPAADLTFQRLAVNREQIEEMGLQSHPTKKTDTRARNFEGESVELESIPPRLLRDMVKAAIEQHINRHRLHNMRIVEQEERETLERIRENLADFEVDDE